MKIISCGCSFMTLDKQYPNTHFTEHVAQALGADLLSLGSVGASNFYISQQVEHAISLNPDLIIVVFTNYDRTEMLNQPGISYDVPSGIKNFSNNVVDSTNPTVSSNVLSAWTTAKYLLRNNQTDLIKRYFTDIYDFGLAYHKDYYLCLGVLHQLRESKIPFVFSHGGMRFWQADPEKVWNSFNDNLVRGTVANPWDNQDYKPGQCSGIYHGSFDTHYEIAQLWLEKIKQSI